MLGVLLASPIPALAILHPASLMPGHNTCTMINEYFLVSV